MERETQEEERRQAAARMCSQSLQSKLGVSHWQAGGVPLAPLLSQDAVSHDNLGHLARGSASSPHSQNHNHHQTGVWGAGRGLLCLFVKG